MDMNNKKNAFTLGEILLAILIAGIIATLTIPSLVKDMNKKARMELLKSTYANIENVTKREFLKEGANHINETDIYSNTAKFLKNFDTAQSGTPLAASYRKLSGDSLSTEECLSCVMLKNGVGILIGDDVGVVVDINGSKKPNIIGVDLFAFGINPLTGELELDDYRKRSPYPRLLSDCNDGDPYACSYLVEQSGFDPDYLKIAQDKVQERIAKRRQFDKWKLASIGGDSSEDYEMTWDEAVEICGGAENLPDEDDLWELAKTIYTNCNEDTKYCTGYNADNVPQNLKDAGFISSWFYLWSGVEKGSYVRNWRFYTHSSHAYSSPRDHSLRVVCVGDL